MNEVVKASIARVSFTLTKEAYANLEKYLNELRDFYMQEGKVAEEEIVDDIEQRIVELLYERGKRESIVTESDISDIIGILGRPKDFEHRESNKSCEDAEATGVCGSENCNGKGNDNGGVKENGSAGSVESNEYGRVKKSLLRDMNRKVIGGVCGGLSHYFNIEIVLIRVILMLFLLLPVIFSFSDWDAFDIAHTIFDKIRAIVVIAYIALWIAMPAARTAQQRCKMMGMDEGVDGIKRMRQTRGCNPETKARGEEIGRAIKCTLGIILMIVGISLIISLISVAIFISTETFDDLSSIPIWQSLNLVNLGFTGNLTYLKALALASWLVPSIGILYGGTKLVFDLKEPKWKPGLIMFLLTIALWTVAIGYIVKSAIFFNSGETMKEVADLPCNNDTLFIAFDKAHGLTGKPAVYWKENDEKLCITEIYRNNGNTSVIKYPEIKLKRNNENDLISITQHSDTLVLFGKNTIFAPYMKFSWKQRHFFNREGGIDGMEDYSSSSFFYLKDSLLTIKPLIIDHNHKYSFTKHQIILYVGANTPVVILNREGFGNKQPHDDYFGEL